MRLYGIWDKDIRCWRSVRNETKESLIDGGISIGPNGEALFWTKRQAQACREADVLGYPFAKSVQVRVFAVEVRLTHDALAAEGGAQ